MKQSEFVTAVGLTIGASDKDALFDPKRPNDALVAPSTESELRQFKVGLDLFSKLANGSSITKLSKNEWDGVTSERDDESVAGKSSWSMDLDIDMGISGFGVVDNFLSNDLLLNRGLVATSRFSGGAEK